MFITFRLYSILSLFTEHEQLEPGRCAGWFQVALVSVRTVSATLVSPRCHNSREHNLETNILYILWLQIPRNNTQSGANLDLVEPNWALQPIQPKLLHLVNLSFFNLIYAHVLR